MECFDEVMNPFNCLDDDSILQIFGLLTVEDIGATAAVCKHFADLARQQGLWKQLFDKHFSRHRLLQIPTREQLDWRAFCVSAWQISSLRRGVWEQIEATKKGKKGPLPREGHAAAPWTNSTFILFGGWGHGIRNDLFILSKDSRATAATPSVVPGPPDTEAQPGPSCRRVFMTRKSRVEFVNAPPALVSGYTWHTPLVAGQKPAIRYGHSVTRCGLNGEMLLVFGGMQSGGYQGEIEQLMVLRPRQGLTPEQALERTLDPANAAPAYEWWEPTVTGDKPRARGYHSATASEDGRHVYISGGIAHGASQNWISVIDVVTWRCRQLETEGQPPTPRFGHSSTVYNNMLWIVGGGFGSDLARSGFDLQDVCTLNLETLSWSRPQPQGTLHIPEGCAPGRCHAAARVGSKLVMFGGSLQLGNSLLYLDLEECRWGQPAISGTPPPSRMSAVMVAMGEELILYGGWIYSLGEMGDLFRVRLTPESHDPPPTVGTAASRGAAASEMAAGASDVFPFDELEPGAEASGSGGGQGAEQASGGGLSKMLNDYMAQYFQMVRMAQEMQDGQGSVPTSVILQMRELMRRIRLLQTTVSMVGDDWDYGGSEEEDAPEDSDSSWQEASSGMEEDESDDGEDSEEEGKGEEPEEEEGEHTEEEEGGIELEEEEEEEEDDSDNLCSHELDDKDFEAEEADGDENGNGEDEDFVDAHETYEASEDDGDA